MVNQYPPKIDLHFWSGKKVLVTGHTGFKGSWLTIWLAQLGCKVTGLSLKPITEPALFEIANISNLCDSHFVDIRDAKQVSDVVKSAQPDVVFHLAAQALVRQGYREPLETFATNTMGTANLLEAFRLAKSVKTAVMVTTDKVYQNNENLRPFKERDTLGGHDPYSASKAASELIIACYRKAFLGEQGVAIASARAGNVIGGGDWSEDRLIPDAIRAWSAKGSLEVRYPDSIRPWQHVLEPLFGYIVLAQQLPDRPELATAFNFGPGSRDTATVKQVIEVAQRVWGNANVIWGDNSSQWQEAARLILDTGKSSEQLGIQSVWTVEQAVKRTIDWYQKQNLGANAMALCKSDINDFEIQVQKNNEQ